MRTLLIAAVRLLPWPLKVTIAAVRLLPWPLKVTIAAVRLLTRRLPVRPARRRLAHYRAHSHRCFIDAQQRSLVDRLGSLAEELWT